MEEKRSFIKKIGNFFSTIILLVLVPYFIISAILMYSSLVNMNINENHLPAFFGFKPVIIHDDSMKGKLDKGDLLIIKEQEDYTQLDTGTIITFSQKKDEYKTREIYKVLVKPDPPAKGEQSPQQAEYNTKARANEKADEARLFSDNIEGVYLFKIPIVGTYLSYIENQWFLVFSLPILAIIIILFFKLKVKCAPKKIKEKKEEKKDLELFSAAELTSGKELREELLNSKTKSNVQTPNVNTPQPPVTPQPTVTPVTRDNQISGGIKIVPPTEVQLKQNNQQIEKAQPQVQPQVQSQPQVIPVNQQVTVVPLNNPNNQQNK